MKSALVLFCNHRSVLNAVVNPTESPKPNTFAPKLTSAGSCTFSPLGNVTIGAPRSSTVASADGNGIITRPATTAVPASHASGTTAGTLGRHLRIGCSIQNVIAEATTRETPT